MPDDSLRIVVAANPGAGITVAPELQLVKAALLYGDSVVLISPASTMMHAVEALKSLSPQQQLELFRQVAPYLAADGDAAVASPALEQIETLLRTKSRARSREEVLVRARLKQTFAKISAQLTTVVGDLASSSEIDQLDVARSKGLVEIDSVRPGSAVDLLAWCVISAKLAESGQTQPGPHSRRLVETFVDKLSQHLSSGRDYLIFDDPIAGLVDAAVREGMFKPAKGPAGRSAQAMAAAGLMARLPTFPDARVDELLDIRKELAPPLIQFRGAMVSVAKQFTSEAWEHDFDDEIHDAWVETVHPALESIEATVQDNKSLVAIASGLVGSAKASYPGLAIVGTSLIGHFGTVAETIGGGLSAAAPLLQTLRERHAAAAEIRMRPFYFLYGVEMTLRH